MAAAAARKGPTKKAPEAASWRVGKRGGVKATFTITREQFDAVRDEAKRRADERGSIRADASEVVRDALGAWLRGR